MKCTNNLMRMLSQVKMMREKLRNSYFLYFPECSLSTPKEAIAWFIHPFFLIMTRGVLEINQNLEHFGKCRKTWTFRTFSLNIKCTLMLPHHYLVYPLEFSFVDEVLLLITWNFHLSIFSNEESTLTEITP